MSYLLYYRQGHPAGYTDDLGIIADENRWVHEELPGWYCYEVSKHSNREHRKELHEWCENNLSSYWIFNLFYLYISSEEDATLFNLAWG